MLKEAGNMFSAKNKKENLASVIKYEGDNETLVWKHQIEDFNMGSQLIVHESQEAIFFRDGQALDLFGAGRYTLETQQLPLLEKLYVLPSDTETTFHSEIYFINLATQMGIKWGTDTKVHLFDPVSNLHIGLGASGEFNIRVIDSRRLLLKIVGTTGFLKQGNLLGNDESKGFFRAMIMTHVKSYLAQTIRENAINILTIDEHLMTLSTALREKINTELAEYGLTMPEFYVSRVLTPNDDPNFRRMKEQYAEQYLLVQQEKIKKNEAEAAQARKAVEAQTEAQMKVIRAQGEAEALKIMQKAQSEAYFIQAAAEAEEMRMKGYNYQQESSRMVGMEAMKNGIGGNGGGGSLGDVASLGVALGAMGGVIGMTKEAMGPLVDGSNQLNTQMGSLLAATEAGQLSSTQQRQQVGSNIEWTCLQCGAQGLIGQYCPECGNEKPEPMAAEVWTCPQCGAQGLTGKFCPECGAKKPEPMVAEVWTCPQCGAQDLTGKFCPECGTKKPESVVEKVWTCPQCGAQGLTGKHCPECGTKRGGECKE